MRNNKGYVLLITIVVTSFIIILALGFFNASYRYKIPIKDRTIALQIEVKK